MKTTSLQISLHTSTTHIYGMSCYKKVCLLSFSYNDQNLQKQKKIVHYGDVS